MRHDIFGTLTWDEEHECWASSREFPTFRPFRITPHNGGKPPSKFEVCVAGEEDAEGPSSEQVKAFQWFLDDEEGACEKIVDGIFRYYLRLREQDRRWFEDQDCPEITAPDELRDLMEFEALQVRSDHHRKTGLLAFTFHCRWDDEHGLAVVMHKDVILEIGGADLAFSTPSAAGSRWLKACTPKERDKARTILKALGAPMRASPHSPHQSLVIAIHSGDEKKIRQLVDKGVDINDLSEGGLHPIFGAINSINVNAVKTMLELGANLRVDAYGTTPLQKAINMLTTYGDPRKMSPGPIRERMEEVDKRIKEIIQILRDAGAE